jgi:hypothetical protein
VKRNKTEKEGMSSQSDAVPSKVKHFAIILKDVITTRRKKRHSAPLKADDGFFEDDCEVLDFARDRERKHQTPSAISDAARAQLLNQCEECRVKRNKTEKRRDTPLR